MRPRNPWYVYVLMFVLSAFVVLAFAIWVVAAKTYRMAGGSMQPTLLTGDYILVNKLAYGLRNPLTAEPLTRIAAPQRGDAIVYRYPQNRDRMFVHRAIGLAGDTIEVRQGMAYINGTALDEPYLRNAEPSDPTSPEYSFGPVTVPAGHLFVLGDNRNSSMDSRAWGFVPLEDVLGRVQWIYWSWDPAGRIRWERIGQTVR